ncbi:MAG: hypothetical protein OXL97_01890 [Chloroflexota bacterium]|nr:hypothetical protein [Chloroflexota bacterium]MDE2886455.1 hypothetical protein [Chloroflexota bacterium]
MRLNLATALSVLIALAGAAAAAVALLSPSAPGRTPTEATWPPEVPRDSPPTAPEALEALERSAARVSAELLPDISPERPFVLVTEMFEKGGHTFGRFDCMSNYVAIYPESVISMTVITPGSDGLVADVTGDIRAVDGTPPVVRSLLDDSIITGPLEDPCPPEEYTEPGDRWDVAGWVGARLEFPRILQEERGYTYVGRSFVNGQPGFRYEDRSRVSLYVIEFAETNPLLIRTSRYTVQDDGKRVLDSQETVISATAGEPEASPGAGTGEGG